jgi:hypothetical protein
MFEPVLFIRDGWTYEREAIEEVLQSGKVSPVSYVGMGLGDTLDQILVINWALKAAIKEFVVKNPDLEGMVPLKNEQSI